MAHHLTPRSDGRYDDLVAYITIATLRRLNGEWQFEQRTVVMVTETRIVDNVGTDAETIGGKQGGPGVKTLVAGGMGGIGGSIALAGGGP
jgi:hypothetical protein